jgi:transcription elongation GreA/GreB family factor
MHAPEPLPPEVAALVEQKNLDALEDVWTQRMEEAPEDLAFFFAVASGLKKKGATESALSWLRFLADYQGEQGRGDEHLAVLLEIARMAPSNERIREELSSAIRGRFADHPDLQPVLAQFPLAGAADPAAVGGRAVRWLKFRRGDAYEMAGRGPGRIAELNPALDVVRVEFGRERVPLSLVSAEKALTPLPPGHFLREKLEDPQALRALAVRDPAELVRRLLASFGGTATLAAVREHLSGLVEEAHWSAFWGAARKNPQIVATGSGKSATVHWAESAGAAEDEVQQSFAGADPERKLEIARRHGKRSEKLVGFFAEDLSAEARRALPSRPGLAWELSQAALRLRPAGPEAVGADEVLATRDPLQWLAGIRDHTAREKALDAIRQRRPEWADVFVEQFLREDDSRVLALIFRALGDFPDRRQELARRILRSPRQAPRAFVWLVERTFEEEGTVPVSLFSPLLDALRRDEFSSVRARIKQFFDPGSVAVAIVRAATSEEQGRELLSALDHAGSLEEHRRATVREALLMRFPGLRLPAREYLYATAEAIEQRRRELQRLRQVELPANAEAMRVAQEHGDLTENFEYHAARQRHEYLSARIATLADELSRSRALDPARVDPSEVRVGTRVLLRQDGGAERTVTILGPWDSRPDEGIYSYLSEFGERLLGRKAGQRVALPEGEMLVASIEPWTTGSS